MCHRKVSHTKRFTVHTEAAVQGSGAFTGTGTFIGSGYYYATFPSDSAEFTGTGLLNGRQPQPLHVLLC